jgi:hypothetical protein
LAGLVKQFSAWQRDVAPARDWLATYQRMIADLAHVESTAASSHVCGPVDLVDV